LLQDHFQFLQKFDLLLGVFAAVPIVAQVVIDIESLFEVIDIEPLSKVIDIESLFEVIDIEPFKQKQQEIDDCIVCDVSCIVYCFGLK
jgi:hypothetical protein